MEIMGTDSIGDKSKIKLPTTGVEKKYIDVLLARNSRDIDYQLSSSWAHSRNFGSS